mmetsp:Transcript_46377/g.107115  ORF Transcript_46377/g.107115 Transcript_46377/m.107115 type:complete len:207 (-) Transcript_46377:746-1366(-)
MESTYCKAGLELCPVKDSVVAMKDRFSQDERVLAQRWEIYGQQFGGAGGVGWRALAQEGRLQHAGTHIRSQLLGNWQTPHVGPRVQGERDALELDVQARRSNDAAVLGVPCRPRQQVVYCWRKRGREPQMRGATVQNAVARAVSACLHPLATNGDRQYRHLPVAELRLCHRHPSERRRHVSRIVASKRDLALLSAVALAQQHTKLR